MGLGMCDSIRCCYGLCFFGFTLILLAFHRASSFPFKLNNAFSSFPTSDRFDERTTASDLRSCPTSTSLHVDPPSSALSRCPRSSYLERIPLRFCRYRRVDLCYPRAAYRTLHCPSSQRQRASSCADFAIPDYRSVYLSLLRAGQSADLMKEWDRCSCRFANSCTSILPKSDR